MGAWGEGPFDNDDALDLLYLLESDPRRVFVERVGPVATSDNEITVDAAGMTVAAAALVAARRFGSPTGDPTADEWLTANPDFQVDPELVGIALAALRRVNAESELRDLMEESDLVDEWTEGNLELMTRLGQDG